MRYNHFILGLLSLLAASCSYVETFVPEDDYDNSAVEFYATIDEQPDADTKVYADDQLRVLWNADDRVTIFNKNTYNQQYRFAGQEGANAGGFRKVQSDDEFITSEPLDLIYSVYPYQETTYINYDETISFILPAEQTYKDSSFGIGANTMVSKTTDNQLRFKNVGGYLSLKFYGEGVSISSITLKGNNGELLAGKCSIDMSSGLPVLTMDEGRATDTITLVCDPAVELGNSSSEAIAFWFVLPPVTFTKGITVTVNTQDGGVFVKSTSNKLEIGRSAITKLGALEVVPEYEQPNNVIYYTSTDGEIVTPSRQDAFGASIISNEYVDGKGIITFDGVVSRIGESAFLNCTNLSSIAIPQNVNSFGNSAFFGCINLGSFDSAYASTDKNCIVIDGELRAFAPYGIANYSIPSCVTKIGDHAFRGCSKIKQITIPSEVAVIGTNAFYGCTTLQRITVNASIPPVGNTNMLYNTNKCPVFVPSACVDAYKKANVWSDYADRIVCSVSVPEAIDVGLSVKWASFNIGASSPEDPGFYYSWGDIATKDDYSWASYRYCSGSSSDLVKYSDNVSGLDDSDDVAKVLLGGKWRMPTWQEYYQLAIKLNFEWVENYNSSGTNGVVGYLIDPHSGREDLLFFPAAGGIAKKNVLKKGELGYYWISNRKDYNNSTNMDFTVNSAELAFCLTFDSYRAGSFNRSGYSAILLNHNRNEGLSVRPVWDPQL